MSEIHPPIHFCCCCGNAIQRMVPAGDNQLRHVCSQCGTIHYQNPKMVVGCIAEWEEKILLCRRAIEPQLGFWTLPAGFMENNETTAHAALRETQEEACANVDIGQLFALINIPHIHQVHLFYTGRLVDGKHSPGEESLDTRLFEESEIPWTEIAFRSVSFALRHWLEDRRRGSLGLHTTDLAPLT